MWNSFVINTVYLIVLICISIWNGSTFYFKVFAKKCAVDAKKWDMEKEREKFVENRDSVKPEQATEKTKLGIEKSSSLSKYRSVEVEDRVEQDNGMQRSTCC